MAHTEAVCNLTLCLCFLLLLECRTEEVNIKCKEPWCKVSPKNERRETDRNAVTTTNIKSMDFHETQFIETPHNGKVAKTLIKTRLQNAYFPFVGNKSHLVVHVLTQYCDFVNVGEAALTTETFEIKRIAAVTAIPENLRVLSKSSNHIEIAWDVPDPPYNINQTYKIEMTFHQIEKIYKITNATSWMFKDLKPYTEYQFIVCAMTGAGWGEWSDPITVMTDEGIPSEPLNLSLVSRSSKSIEVQWRDPEHKNAAYVSYIVRWIQAENLINSSNSVMIDNESWDETEVEDTTTHKIYGLESYTYYSVQVCAKTSAGRGKFTVPILVQTTAGIPGKPKKLEVVDVKSTEMTFKWTAPEFRHSLLKGYEILWGVEGTNGSRLQTTLNVYRALGLRPYTSYFFKVSATTEGGVGPPNVTYNRTDISTPSSARRLQVISVTDHCILLQWDAPENPNAALIQYNIQWSKVLNYVNQSHDVNTTSYRIRFLEPFTNYSIRVTPFNTAGYGPPTEWLQVQTKTKDRSTVVVSVSVVSGVIVLSVICGTALFCFLKKKNTQNCQHCQEMNTREKCKLSGENMEISQATVSFKLGPLRDSKRISVGCFDEHILKLMSNGYYLLAQEFEGQIKSAHEQLGRKSPSFSADEAKKSDNLNKNRWTKILPFDHSRVKLLPIGDEAEPDYINASYIPGESYMLEYIATQGPLQSTINDFWRMMWQESVFLIVMLTQCVERAKRNCEVYWPKVGTSALYGDVEVRNLSEDTGPSFTRRLFLVTQDRKQRHVVHLHYMRWPVTGCPKSPNDFLNFIQVVRSEIRATAGPLLVHCSAGVGRTGTFIAVDRLSQQLAKRKDSEDIDVYGTILEMRKYRPNLVQSEEQYYFIYLCVQRLIQQNRTDIDEDFGGGIYAN